VISPAGNGSAKRCYIGHMTAEEFKNATWRQVAVNLVHIEGEPGRKEDF